MVAVSWESDCLADVSREDLRQVQAKMRAKLRPRPKNKLQGASNQTRRWSDATINRHFAFLRHVLMLAVKDGKLTQKPRIWFEVLPRSRQRTRWLASD